MTVYKELYGDIKLAKEMHVRSSLMVLIREFIVTYEMTAEDVRHALGTSKRVTKNILTERVSDFTSSELFGYVQKLMGEE